MVEKVEGMMFGRIWKMIYFLFWFIFPSTAFNTNAQTWVLPEQLNGSNTNSIVKLDSHLFVVDFFNNVWRSSDDGITWHKKFVIDSLNDIRELQHFENSTLYAISYNNGLFKSTDYGETWVAMNNGISTNVVRGLFIHSTDTLFACTNVGLFRSFNNGTNWELFSLAAKDMLFFHIDEHDNYYAKIINSSTYRSTNGGITWNTINLPDASKMLSTDENKLFAFYSSAIYSSINNGQSWTKITPNYYPYSINDMEFLKNENKLIFSLSNGLTLKYNIVSSQFTDSIYIDSYKTGIVGFKVYSNSELFAASKKGPLKSSNGGISWLNLNGNLKSFTVYGLNYNEGKILANTSIGLYMDSLDGESWERINWNKIFNINKVKYIQQNIFVCSDSGLFKSSNLGISWTRFQNKVGLKFFDIMPIGIDTLLLCGDSVYISSDAGLTWRNVLLWIPLVGSFGANSCGKFSSGKMIAAGYNSTIKIWFISTDGGLSWTDLLTAGTTQKKLFISHNDILFSYYSSPPIANNRIYRSSNFGVSFDTIIVPGILSLWDVVENSLGEIFIATNVGILKTTNNGDSWTDYSGHLNDDIVRTLAINDDGVLFSGMFAAGLFRTLHSTTNLKEEKNFQPENFFLHQNYPNPFNPSTKIKFTIPALTPSLSRGERVLLKVYDILGREVATLVNKELSAGEYEVEFNTTDKLRTINYQLSTNIYFYQLRIDGLVETKKMVYLK